MNRNFYILIIILFFACEKDDTSISVISNDADMNTEYKVNLNWNESEDRLKTGVNIIWKQWKEDPLLSFIKYEIYDVSTDEPKWINQIEEKEDTTYQVDFPTGTFYRLCVLAHYHDIANDLNLIISSDSIQFFTQPLSAINNLTINPQPLETIINWNPSPDQDINKLIVYRAEILNDYLNQSNVSAPTLEASMISNNTGEIEDSTIIYLINQYEEGNEIGAWRKIYQGTNSDISYIDTEAVDPNYAYYYAINVKIEDFEDDNESIIANYRYSIIKPANVSEEINLIENSQNITLSVDDDQKNIIALHWNEYEGDDFYSYEIWRTDIESIDIESLESNGEKLVEITARTQDFFEDLSLVGSEKTFYYFIRVNNNYGDSIESNIVEGDTTL